MHETDHGKTGGLAGGKGFTPKGPEVQVYGCSTVVLVLPPSRDGHGIARKRPGNRTQNQKHQLALEVFTLRDRLNYGYRTIRRRAGLLSAGLFDNALASLGEDGSAALSEDVRRRRPVGMVTADRRRDDARLFSCV